MLQPRASRTSHRTSHSRTASVDRCRGCRAGTGASRRSACLPSRGRCRRSNRSGRLAIYSAGFFRARLFVEAGDRKRPRLPTLIARRLRCNHIGCWARSARRRMSRSLPCSASGTPVAIARRNACSSPITWSEGINRSSSSPRSRQTHDAASAAAAAVLRLAGSRRIASTAAPNVLQLPLDEEALFLSAHHDRRGELVSRTGAQRSVEQRLLPR